MLVLGGRDQMKTETTIKFVKRGNTLNSGYNLVRDGAVIGRTWSTGRRAWYVVAEDNSYMVNTLETRAAAADWLCGQLDRPPAAPTGYTDCACRDCMDIAIGVAGAAYCHGCRDAGCPGYQGQPGMSQECQRPDAYGAGEETPDSSELVIKAEPTAGMTARAATGQPAWRTLYATDYSRVETDDTGVYAPEMEVAQEIADEPDGTFDVFRFSLDRLQSVFPDGGAHCLIPVNYGASWRHPAADYDAWFTCGLDDVASSCGTTHRELVEALTGDDIAARAWAYECIGGYHGYANLDSDPLRLTEDELNTRWNRTVR